MTIRQVQFLAWGKWRTGDLIRNNDDGTHVVTATINGRERQVKCKSIREMDAVGT